MSQGPPEAMLALLFCLSLRMNHTMGTQSTDKETQEGRQMLTFSPHYSFPERLGKKSSD